MKVLAVQLESGESVQGSAFSAGVLMLELHVNPGAAVGWRAEVLEAAPDWLACFWCTLGRHALQPHSATLSMVLKSRCLFRTMEFTRWSALLYSLRAEVFAPFHNMFSRTLQVLSCLFLAYCAWYNKPEKAWQDLQCTAKQTSYMNVKKTVNHNVGKCF